MNLKTLSPAKKAIIIGGMCALSYLAVYIARNVLGAVTPHMIESGHFVKETIGTMSSIYFITYAVGQLINGLIGDKIKAKYMISLGLFLAGIASVVFAFYTKSVIFSYITYGAVGFFLSMIYAPMTKVVAENTDPLYTTRCSLGYEFASLLGSPLAGVLAAVLIWQGVFVTSSSFLIVIGIVFFVVFSVLERKGVIKYGQYKREKLDGNPIKVLIKYDIIKFTLIALLTGVVRTAVVFWLPTYFNEYLEFSAKTSSLIFTVATFIISLTTFITIFVYEKLGHNMNLTVFLCFSVSAIGFLAVYFLKVPVLNIIFIVLAIMAANGAATMLWSRYCPSLRDTGMVSSATGFLDFMSYMAASLSSSVFANAVSDIGWGNLILVWFALMVVGVIVSLPYKKGAFKISTK